MVKDEVTKLFKKEIQEQINKIAQESLNLKVDHFKSVVKKSLAFGGLIGLGLLFFLFGLLKYIPKILGISEGAAFISIGAVLIIVALIFRAGSKA
jgi:hypothetical protein